MQDSLFGRRDKTGHWLPSKPVEYPQVFVWPAKPLPILKWIPSYLFPWNALYAVIAVFIWMYMTPSIDAMKSLSWDWVGFIFARNFALVLLFFGAYHVRLYIQKAQGTNFKFNAKWPDRNNPVFLFGNQTVDNMIWTLGSGLPIWTAYEVLTLWFFANGYIPMVDWETNPLWFAALMLLIPLFREVHFYVVHRMIHWPPLYRWVHSLHHNNINPGPWSGLSMHPIEHLLYFSGVIVHWFVPSHPIHALYHLVHLGLSPAGGHTGYERIVVGENQSFDSHCYAHYLHHKYFECNYADGNLPLDKWFGSFHDGTNEAQDAMNRRFLKRHARKARAR